MDYYSSSSYKLGIVKGLLLAKKGIPEIEAVSISADPAYLDGIHEGYSKFFNKAYGDAVKSLRKAIREKNKIQDALYQLHEATIYRKLHIVDATDFTLRKETDWKYSVDKDGQHVYTLTKDKNGKWHCSCTGYSFRHTCKHVDALNNLLNQNTQRLPQHLARVRQLENSLKIWKERLNDPKYAKQAQKQVDLREKALAAAKEVADKIEAMPKPTRHPREEFEPVIPLLDKLFKGLAPYEIVGSWRRGKCFAAGTKVRVPLGWRNIEDLQIGDEVFNGFGELTKVTRTFKEPQTKWCRVNYRRGSSLVCTPDHKFLVWKSNSPRKDFEWVEAQNLTSSGHWRLVTPLLTLPETISIGKERAFLLGWYLADGNIHLVEGGTYKNPRFTLNGRECMYVNFAANSLRRKEFLVLLAELGFYDFSFYSNRDEDNTLSINVRDSELIEFLVDWGGLNCKELSLCKKADSRILSLLDEEKDAFLHGFWLGDGTYGKYNTSLSCRFYNTIKEIVDLLDTLLSRKYRTLRYFDPKEKEEYKDSYEVRITGNNAISFITDLPDFIAKSKYTDNRTDRVVSVEKQFKAHAQSIKSVELFEKSDYRYCIEVADGESFIAENFSVHNSTYKDADILTVMDKSQWNTLKDRLQEDDNFGPAPGHTHPDMGDDIIRGGYTNGDRVEYLDINRVTDPDNYGAWLLFRTGCFSGDTRVLTPKGHVRIDEIEPGDVVLSGTGSPTKVTAVAVKTFNDTVTFKSRGSIVTSTLDHRVLIAGNGTQGASYDKPKWQEAGTLGRYCSLVYPKIQLATDIEVDDRLAFLLGFYMADGCLSARLDCPGNKKHIQSVNYRVDISEGICSFGSRFSIPFDKRSEFIDIFNHYNIPIYSITGGRGNEGTIIVKDKTINEFLFKYAGVTIKKLNFSKKFDNEILRWNQSAKMELLKGFFLGDGTLNRAKWAMPRFLNTNKEILYGLWLLAKTEYHVGGIKVTQGKGLPIYSFTVFGAEAQRIYKELLCTVCKAKGVDPIMWSNDPVYKVSFEGIECVQRILRGKPVIRHWNEKVYVYDIEVEDSTHSFLIEDGFIVHNSAQFNIACRGWLKKFGCGLNEHGIKLPDGSYYKLPTEQAFFDWIGIPFISPEKREGAHEFYRLVRNIDEPVGLKESFDEQEHDHLGA